MPPFFLRLSILLLLACTANPAQAQGKYPPFVLTGFEHFTAGFYYDWLPLSTDFDINLDYFTAAAKDSVVIERTGNYFGIHKARMRMLFENGKVSSLNYLDSTLKAPILVREFIYSGNRLVSFYAEPSIDYRRDTFRLEYDSLGRLLKVTMRERSKYDKETKETYYTYRYDKDTLKSYRRDHFKVEDYWVYDRQGLPLKSMHKPDSGNEKLMFSYEYDAQRRLKKVTNPGAYYVCEVTYGKSGQVELVQMTDIVKDRPLTDKNRSYDKFIYDKKGKMVEMISVHAGEPPVRYTFRYY